MPLGIVTTPSAAEKLEVFLPSDKRDAGADEDEFVVGVVPVQTCARACAGREGNLDFVFG
jgi:hypothetical protein